MFDFLQQLSHQHPKKQTNPQNKPSIHKSPPLSTQQQRDEIKKGKRKNISLSSQLQQGQTSTLDPQTLNILQKMRDQSEKWLKEVELGMIMQDRSRVERKVYLREMNENYQQYLEEILIQTSSPNQYLQHGLSDIITSVTNNIYGDILQTNKYQISKKNGITKEELYILQKSLHHIRNKQGNIRDKVGDLKMQLQTQSQKINQRSEDIVNKKSFNMHDPKTRQVQLFLKNVQMDTHQHHLKYEEQIQKEKQKKRKRAEIMEIARQKAKSERHERIAEAYEIKRKIKNQENNIQRKRRKQFNEFMKEHKNKKPLFIEKQQKFIENVVHKNQQQIFNAIMKRKQFYAPMSFDDIEEHEQRYFQYKNDNAVRHNEEIRMNKQAEKKRIQELNALHKGEFRLHVLEQMIARKQELSKDPKEEIKRKRRKQMMYSQNVKQFRKPTVDPAKKMEMQASNPLTHRKRYRNPIRVRSSVGEESGQFSLGKYQNQQQEVYDAKKQGQRNRRYFKEYIRQKIQKGEIKKPQNTTQSLTISPKTNYLEQMRRQKDSSTSNLKNRQNEIEVLKENGNFGGLMARIHQIDEKSKRLEDKFRMAAHKPSQEAELEDNYLFAIKAKMELINNYD